MSVEPLARRKPFYNVQSASKAPTNDFIQKVKKARKYKFILKYHFLSYCAIVGLERTAP
jgi:hypothetical protein